MQKLTLISLAAAAALAAMAPSQSWATLVANRWPGDSIRKVSEKEFEAFVTRHAPSLGKAGAYDAFLTAQHLAHGLTTNARWSADFAVPTDDRRLAQVLRVVDGLVLEGPEPNGDPNAGGTPTPMSCGDQADGAVDVGGDADWYVFTLPSLATVQALTAPGLAGVGLPGILGDTVLEVYDSSFALVGYNDDYSIQYTSAIRRRTYSFCELELPAGLYYVSVRAFSSSATGTYSLDLRCTQPFQIVSEGPEPNDSPAAGGTPTPMAFGQQADGECGTPAGDHDWYQFMVTQTTSVLMVTGPSLQNTGAIGDSTLTLWDVNYQSIATDDDGGPLAYSQIHVELQPGTYYADVAGYNGAPGTYRLLLIEIPVPSNPIAEAAEPNGDPRNGGVPSQIGCDQTGTGEVVNMGGSPPAGDDDWWTFTTTADGLVTIYTLPNDSATSILGSINDTELWLYDAAYNELAYDDDNGTGLFSEVSAWLTAGTYHARVEGYGATDVGTYYITIECSGGLPGFATIPAGCTGSNGLIPSVTTRDLELAILGTTFVADYINLPPNGIFFPFVGFSRTTTSSGFQLPLDLGPIGAPGCFVASDPLVALQATATQYGSGTLALGIPLSTPLVGVVLYTQAIVFDRAANAFGVTTSDVGAIVIGDRL